MQNIVTHVQPPLRKTRRKEKKGWKKHFCLNVLLLAFLLNLDNAAGSRPKCR